MFVARRVLVGLLLTGCEKGDTATDWIDVDLMGTDQTWSMYPDRCYAVSDSAVDLEEDGYPGARLKIAADPHTGVRIGVTIPDEPISLWLDEEDGCRVFDVALMPGDDGVAARLELDCELPWIGVWADVTFTNCG